VAYAFTSGTGTLAYAIFPVPTATLPCTAEANPSGKAVSGLGVFYHPPGIQGWAGRARELSPLLGKSGSPLKGEKGKTGFYICVGQVESLPEQSCNVRHTVPVYKGTVPH